MMTTSRFFGLSLEILEEWIITLGINANNVVIGTDVPANIDSKYSVCCHQNDFSGRLLNCINLLEVDMVLILLDDYKLISFDLNTFKKGLRDFYTFKASAMKLVPNPFPDIFIPGHYDFGMCSIHTHWRINSQPTVFSKSFLCEILFPPESLWDFEINASIRSLALPCNIMSPINSIADYREIIKGGRILSLYYDLYGVKFTIEKIPAVKSLMIIIEGNLKRLMIELLGYSFTRKFKLLMKLPLKFFK